LLGLISTCGYGLVGVRLRMDSGVPFGWRGLFVLAFIPLLLMLPLWRLLPESRLFEGSSKAMGDRVSSVSFARCSEATRNVLSKLPRSCFSTRWAGTPAGLIQSKYLQEVHRWNPGKVSPCFSSAALQAPWGTSWAGIWGDRIGRRVAGTLFIALVPVFGTLFFNSSGDLMVAAWIIALFGQTAASSILNTFAAELFPTSHRSTANNTIAVAATLGGSTSLMLEDP